jgi:predicted DsbA family dithiol-disulfide isomerase
MAKHHHIVMYMDVICEWCYLARHVLDTLRDEYDFDIEYRFMEIHPDAPEEGMPMTKHVRSMEYFYGQLNRLGEPYGVKFAPKNLFANTYYALVLLQCAQERGQLDRILDPIWDAYMLEGKNISLLPELVKITDACGLPRSVVSEAYADQHFAEQIERNYQQNHADGGEGKVPLFFVDGEYVMHGAQDADTWRELFQKLEQE